MSTPCRHTQRATRGGLWRLLVAAVAMSAGTMMFGAWWWSSQLPESQKRAAESEALLAPPSQSFCSRVGHWQAEDATRAHTATGVLRDAFGHQGLKASFGTYTTVVLPISRAGKTVALLGSNMDRFPGPCPYLPTHALPA